MTRKDYVLIAAALLESKPTDKASPAFRPAYAQWSKSCMRLANTLKNANASFDRERFLAACEGKKG